MKQKKYMKTLAAILLTASMSLGGGFTAFAASSSFGNQPGGMPPMGGMNSSSGQQMTGQQMPGQQGGSSANVSWSGAKTISASTTESGKTYSSTTADQNALLVTGGTSTINNATVNKSGDSDGGDSSNFYGTNSGILVKDGASLTVEGSTISTTANGANGVFSYGGNGGTNGASGDGTTVNINNTKITTTGNNAGGTMTTGGGTTNVTDCDITTSGTSSAPLRTDRGGGTLNVTGGTYTSNGTGSPAIYSTATVTVNDATLVSNVSEGVVIEGSNSVTLKNTSLTANNTKKNGQSTTFQGVMLYQSMSGDAASGGDSFTAADSTITNKNGSVFYVTNQTSTINLNNTSITNSDSDNVFLLAAAGAWGTSGSNGGKATVNASNQTIKGNIKTDSISSVNLNLKDNSTFTGAITNEGDANVVIEAGSSWKLTGNSTVTNLTAAAGTIDLNGYSLTVNGEAYDGSSAIATNNANTVTTDNSNGQNMGQVPSNDIQNGQGFGQQQGSGQQQGMTPPSMPNGQDSNQQQGMTLPSMPNGQDSNQQQGMTPPSMTNGQDSNQQQGSDQQQALTPPSMPNGQDSSQQQGSDQQQALTPPFMPNGQDSNQQQGSDQQQALTPPSMPNGQEFGQTGEGGSDDASDTDIVAGDEATDEEEEAAEITGFTVKKLSNSKIKISWDELDDADKYQIRYKVGTGKWRTKKTTSTSLTMKLNTQKSVRIKVRAYIDEDGWTDWSETKKVQIRKTSSSK